MNFWAGLGALNAFLAVSAGAFGAHALKSRLTADLQVIFETGARYHMYHALGLFAVALLADRGHPVTLAGSAMILGIVLFSGSLYALALTGVRTLGAITPLGGVAFLVGWGLLVWTCVRNKSI